MLKRPITYTNFNDEEVTEEFYFNISIPEMVELEAERPGGFSAWIKEIIETEDNKVIMEQFRRIILLAYGEKSADGKHFVKNEALRESFASSAAYVSLYTEMIMNEGKAAEFIMAVIPKDAAQKAQAALAETNAQAAPITPEVSSTT